MICSIADFVSLWAREAETTSEVFAAMTDASLAVRIAPNHRTLGEVAWHIVTTIPEMMSATGLPLSGPDPESPTPVTAKIIAQTYDDVATCLLRAINDGWNDASLAIEDEMYGQRWTRQATLTALVVHQIHHRGQVSVLMRQAGLVVPSIYGPNKEEMEMLRQKT